jgi:hypothetical protein
MSDRETRNAIARIRAAATHLRQQAHLNPLSESLRAAILRDADDAEAMAGHLHERLFVINAHLAAIRRARRAA